MSSVLAGLSDAVNPRDKVAIATRSTKDPSRPNTVLVVYVGGTIGMKRNKLGALEPSKGYLTEKMKMMKELHNNDLVANFDIIECDPLLDSSNMMSEDYMNIARIIYTAYDRYSGFLIAIGTDTMHYAASALSFLLYNVAKPVIVTGAMIPLAIPFNDARRNIVISMMLASHPAISEVCIFFNDSLFRGNRCEKVRHTFSAFHSPAYPPLSVVTGKDFSIIRSLLLPQPTGPLRLLSDMSGKVFVFHMNPMADVDTLLLVISGGGIAENTSYCPISNNKDSTEAPEESKKCPQCKVEPAKKEKEGESVTCKPDAIVLVIRGVGALEGKLAKELKRIEEMALKYNVVVCVTIPEVRKPLSPAAARALRTIVPSFVYLHDMCISTAEVKVLYLFGKGLPPSEVAKMMPLNIRGEVTPVDFRKSEL